MSEDEKNKKPVEGAEPGKPKEEAKSPSSEKAKSQDGKDGNANAELEKAKSDLAKTNQLLETYKNQVSGSQSEAIRLKEEVERLTDLVEDLKASQPTTSSRGATTDDSFKKLIDDKGELGAIRHVVREELSSIEGDVNKLLDKDSKQLVDHFRSQHPGLKDDANLERFNVELKKLRIVYSDPREAMEKAYQLIDGKDLDANVKSGEQKDKEDIDLSKKSEEDKKRAAGKVSSGGEDKKPSPQEQVTSSKLDALKSRAFELEAQGKDASEAWAAYQRLKDQVGSRV